jgi:hypothetical protein
VADPSTALYWHIGDTAMRFASVTPPILMGMKRCGGLILFPWF